MARKTVVLQPPRTPRQTVVLREGPRRHRTAWGDVAAGILGALLLILSGILVEVLPEEDIIIPQYRVTFADALGDPYPTQRPEQPIEAGRFWEAEYPIEHDNVYVIGVTVEFQDDEASSLPDEFTVELIAPNGDIVGNSVHLVTKESKRRTVMEQANATDPENMYTNDLVTQPLQFQIVQKPTDQVVDAASPQETLDEAAARLLPAYSLATNGTWKVRVTLDQAGGCPQPTADPDELTRSSVCNQRLAETNGQDLGNPFSITLLNYSYYTPSLVPLDG